jgi:hypothetical protein
MLSASDENKLKSCLARTIAAIGQCLHKLKTQKQVPAATTTEQQPLHGSDDDVLSEDGHLNTNIDKFTLDKVETDLLDLLTEDIEALLDECFPYLTSICSNSFADYLHQYHYNREEQKFSRSLTKNVLPSMRQELKGFFGTFT